MTNADNVQPSGEPSTRTKVVDEVYAFLDDLKRGVVSPGDRLIIEAGDLRWDDDVFITVRRDTGTQIGRVPYK